MAAWHGEFSAGLPATQQVARERASGQRALTMAAALAVCLVGGFVLWIQAADWLVAGTPELAGVAVVAGTALLGIGVFVVGTWLTGMVLPAMWLGRDATRTWRLKDARHLARASSRARPERVFELLDRFQGRQRPLTRQGRLADSDLVEHVRRTGGALRVRVFAVQSLVLLPVLLVPVAFVWFPDALLSMVEFMPVGATMWLAIIAVGYAVSVACMRLWCVWYRDEVLSYRAPPRPPHVTSEASTA